MVEGCVGAWRDQLEPSFVRNIDDFDACHRRQLYGNAAVCRRIGMGLDPPPDSHE
jgi:hypothetical protein